ncbi:MAG: hypothetical protein NTV46_00100 [Verrucomicrobia bacterium]|nr:hypothetical protein [Verrucomicrobiota bacterium]
MKYLIIGILSVVIFYALWISWTPGAPDSGRVPLLSYWSFYMHTDWSYEYLWIGSASLVLLILPLILLNIKRSRNASERFFIAFFYYISVIIDFLIRRLEFSAIQTGDMGLPPWLTWKSFVISIIVISFFLTIMNVSKKMSRY